MQKLNQAVKKKGSLFGFALGSRTPLALSDSKFSVRANISATILTVGTGKNMAPVERWFFRGSECLTHPVRSSLDKKIIVRLRQCL